MQPRSVCSIILFISVLVFPVMSNANEDAFFNEAKLLIENNESDRALELLETHMDDYAGLPKYDYLVGQAALKAKKPNLAIFALERLSLTKPDFYNARFLLGRAYLDAGELEQANREFNLILNSSNKESLREASKRYINTINNLKATALYAANVTLTLGVGHDSNANSATDNPEYNGLPLSAESVETKSMVTKAILAGSFSYALNRRFRLSAQSQFFKFDYADASFVNTKGAVFAMGVRHAGSKTNSQSLNASYQHVLVDDLLNSKQLASTASHYHILSDSFSVRATMRGAQVEHREEYKIRNFRTVNGGLQLYNFQKTKEKDSITSSFSLIGGIEKPIFSNSLFGRKYATALAGIVLGSNTQKASISTDLSYTYSRYDKRFGGINRNDKSVSLSTKLNLKPHKKWTITPSFRVMRTRSPIDLFNYDKVQLMFLVSRQLV